MTARHQPEVPTAIDIRTTRPRLRSGLRFIPKSSANAAAWFRLEDDQYGRFHRIGLAEYEFLLALDGSRTIEQARELAATTSGQKNTLTPDQSESLLHWAMSESLIAGQDSLQRAGNSRSKASLAWVKLPLVSGDAQWNLPTSMFGWMFDWRSFVAVIAIWFIAIGAVMLDYSRFAGDVVAILEPSGWIRFACVWLSLKIVHELGHIVCCRRFDGRVGEAGVAWMLVAPVAYVDLTDLYRMKSRTHRVLTCLGGIYFEMIIAGFSALLWSQSISPWCNHLFATVAVTASAGSLLFNLNPLIKLDGYHAVCDWIGRPHLASDGAKSMNGVASRIFLGKRNNRNETCLWLITYGIAAFGYRIAIMIGLVAGSYAIYGRVGFVVVGLLTTMSSLPALVRALSGILTQLRARPAAAIRMLFVALCLLGMAGTTWQLQGRLQSGWCGIVEYSDDSPVRCLTAGKVVRVLVESGQIVEAGDVIIELENLSVVAQREKAESELAAGQVRWKRLRELHSTASAASEQEANRAIETRLQSLLRQEHDLIVCAPRSGIVIANEPSRWLGQWLEEGKPLVYVVDETKKKVIVAVPQDAIASIATILGERICFRDSDGVKTDGFVTSVTYQAELTPPHPAMAATAGGQLAVRDKGNESGEAMLLSPHLQLEAMIDDTFKRLRPGQTLTLVR